MKILAKFEGKIRWRDAYRLQLESHEKVLGGEAEGIIHFLEHDFPDSLR